MKPENQVKPKNKDVFAQFAGEISSDRFVEKVRTKEAFNEVCRLRYKVYVEEMKRNVCETDVRHDERTIIDELDGQSHDFRSVVNGKTVGALRLSFSSEVEFPYEELYLSKKVQKDFNGEIALVTKFVVLPEYRRTRVFHDLVQLAFLDMLRRGTKASILDCNDHLVSVFSRLGFRQYRPDWQHPEYGNVHAMVLDNFGEAYMREVRSPLLLSLMRFKRDQKKVMTAAEPTRVTQNVMEK